MNPTGSQRVRTSLPRGHFPKVSVTRLRRPSFDILTVEETKPFKTNISHSSSHTSHHWRPPFHMAGHPPGREVPLRVCLRPLTTPVAGEVVSPRRLVLQLRQPPATRKVWRRPHIPHPALKLLLSPILVVPGPPGDLQPFIKCPRRRLPIGHPLSRWPCGCWCRRRGTIAEAGSTAPLPLDSWLWIGEGRRQGLRQTARLWLPVVSPASSTTTVRVKGHVVPP